MKKIIFICTGNTCRSAMAQGYMKKIVEEMKLQIEVYSAGIYAQDGEKASLEAKEVMKKYGVDLEKHRATSLKKSCILKADIILCATLAHKQIIIQMFPELKDKVYTIKEYAYGIGSYSKDIQDPWGQNINSYENCAKEITDAIKEVVKKQLDEKKE